ncbi:hypothetical protein ABFS83_10G029000 [Erythranthe nasuta]
MEEARYWMWAGKSKPDLDPHLLAATAAAMNSSYNESWEEQAFAEDAAGVLGGCVWPPRSYSCSFCRREFRSAQALGGHMNVHRRDRARLKQSPAVLPSSADQVIILPPHINNAAVVNYPASLDAPPPPPYSYYNSSSHENICSFLYSNPNPEFSPTSQARVSHPAKVVDADDTMTSSPPPPNPCFLSSSSLAVRKNDREIYNMVPSLLHSIPRSWSSFIAEKRDGAVLSDSIRNDGEKKSTAGVDHQQEISRATEKAAAEDCVTDDLSTSLNLVVRRTQTNTSSDEEVASFKRRKIESTKPDKSEVFKFSSGSVEDELDLELRLGNILQR